MKAKEKAKELVDRYFNELHVGILAKQCALIAVESSKESAVYTVVDYKEVDESEWVHFKGYWQEVKQEIERYDT